MEEMSRNELYQKTREDLLKRQLSNNENFDRSILTLSSAALALSVAFLQVGTSHNCFPMLVLAWVGFVVSIISTVISYLTSQKGILRQLDLAEKYYQQNEESALTAENHAAAWTNRCAYISVTAFVLAIILLLIYFAINLPLKKERSPVSDNKSTSSTPKSNVEKGASVPDLQRVEGGASVPRMQAAPTEDRGATVPQLQPAPSTTPPPQSTSPPPSTDSPKGND